MLVKHALAEERVHPLFRERPAPATPAD